VCAMGRRKLSCREFLALEESGASRVSSPLMGCLPDVDGASGKSFAEFPCHVS
jgi:hypothetical protein